VSAFRSALEVDTREQLPQDWAMIQNNLVVPRRGFSWERGMFSGALFRGNWRVNYGVI
jgi:hypothetical protein